MALGSNTGSRLTVHPLDLREPGVGSVYKMGRRPAGLATCDRTVVEDGDTLLLERQEVGDCHSRDARPHDADVHVEVGRERSVAPGIWRRHPYRDAFAVVGLHRRAPFLARTSSGRITRLRHINFNTPTAAAGSPTIFTSRPAPRTSVRMDFEMATHPPGV